MQTESTVDTSNIAASHGSPAIAGVLPAYLPLIPVSRRPIQLPEATIALVDHLPIPVAPKCSGHPPAASIVVVTFNNLMFTRMCLASLITQDAGLGHEVIVVDNASTDGTRDYLRAVADENPHVRLILNESNRGFAAANNQGLAIALGMMLVLLNNDTIVPPGWLGRLRRHLDNSEIGLVGPVTNRIGNEAEIETTYQTFGEFCKAALARRDELTGQTFELPRPAMFCLAMRRDAFERIGPLDEGFGMGYFEDDDYAMRSRAMGLLTRGAEDVMIHHFGEASFGQLFGDGRRDEAFAAGRRRFESKWALTWSPPTKRLGKDYQSSIADLARWVRVHTPPGSRIAVVSKGDERVRSAIGDTGRIAVHFPADENDTYPGHLPATSDELRKLLCQSIECGIEYLAIPNWSGWWLQEYPRLLLLASSPPYRSEAGSLVISLKRLANEVDKGNRRSETCA